MKITLAQIDIRLNRSNIERHIDIIKQHASTSDVIVFPELSLNGYMLQDKVYEDAYTLDELTELFALSKQVDIALGVVLRSENKILNSALYISGGELLHRHDKIHLPNYGMFEEARFFSKGEVLQSFQTAHGNSCMVVCEDLWRADMITRIANEEPKVLYVLSNSPARDFSDEGLKIASQWEAILKTTAMLAYTHVIFVNRVGFEDGLGFWGGSMVITPQGAKDSSFKLFDEQIETVTLNHSLHAIERLIIKHD